MTSYICYNNYIAESAKFICSEGADQSQTLQSHESLKLLITGEDLKIPITQKHPPLTEDMQVRLKVSDFKSKHTFNNY